MVHQASLFGLEEPRPTDRLFFALYPERSTAAGRMAQLASDLKRQHRLSGKILDTERFHVTLHHMGDFAGLPPQLVRAAGEAAAALRFPPFPLAFDRVESFDKRRGGGNAFVLRGGRGLEAVTDFQRTLGEAMKKVGLKPEMRFTPHVTLLYDDRVMPAQPVTPIEWCATEFVLVHSLLGRSAHLRLGAWPLLEGAAR